MQHASVRCMGCTAYFLCPGSSRGLRKVDVCFARNSRFNFEEKEATTMETLRLMLSTLFRQTAAAPAVADLPARMDWRWFGGSATTVCCCPPPPLFPRVARLLSGGCSLTKPTDRWRHGSTLAVAPAGPQVLRTTDHRVPDASNAVLVDTPLHDHWPASTFRSCD